MKRRLVRRCMPRSTPLVAALFFACAVPNEPVAPPPADASEGLDVSVAYRDRSPGEAMMSVRVDGRRGALTIDVVRPAFCATVVSANVARGVDAIDVIANVGPNPGANCAPIPPERMVTYHMTVPQVAPGLVSVRVFEAIGDRPPVSRGQARVAVTP